MAEHSPTIRLKLPPQDLQFLTLGSDQPRRLQTWVEELPVMNAGESSRQLFRFVQELNRVRVRTPLRLRLLEIVRPALVRVTRSLGRHYLNQSLVLPERSRCIAGLAQAMEAHLADGYKLVAVRGLRRLQEKEGPELVGTAIHRALATLGDMLVRSYQLYWPAPPGLWLELHQLYLLAERHGLAHVPVPDPEADGAPTTPAQLYTRILLLASARPNQLRQQEIALVYDAAREWAAYVEIKEAGDAADLFVFDLESDRPPIYRTHASVAGPTCRYIDSRLLTGKLARAREGVRDDFPLPPRLGDALLGRLQQAWSVLAERSFRRQSQQGEVGLLLGLGALFTELAGDLDVSALQRGGQPGVLQDEDANPFLGGRRVAPRREPDDGGWSRAWGTPDHSMADDIRVDEIDFTRINTALAEHQRNRPRQSVEHYRGTKVNASPGGYCLEWQGDTPAALRTGELLGVREPHGAGWAVGVIRWVKQSSSDRARIGVELLAPGATPCCARSVRKTGAPGEFLRALMLPALAAIGQPATLLLPSVGFAVGAAVEVARPDGTRRATLGRQLNGTASFGQYEYAETTPAGCPTGQQEEQGDDFDSVWNSL